MAGCLTAILAVIVITLLEGVSLRAIGVSEGGVNVGTHFA
jgi:hypothetical protein